MHNTTHTHTHTHTHCHTHTHTHTHSHTSHVILNPTYQSSVLPTNAADVSARRTHGALAVSMPTQPPREQEEDTSHTLVAAEALEEEERHCHRHKLCYPKPASHFYTLSTHLPLQLSHSPHLTSRLPRPKTLVSCTARMRLPARKRSGEQSPISWACYPKGVMTNEIVRSVIIT